MQAFKCSLYSIFHISHKTPKLSIGELTIINQKWILHANNDVLELEKNMDGDVLFITEIVVY